ncbi:NUDIX hydrolase [Corynebacterium cystitidis]|uniref:8-oxo-dGTP diphosphatase n=1 Tax=Corynebacterium cystitidis DSM 20524 TaxID=1121357 RepID=A0A1H9VDK4_9CORY|nr:bifunctional NUDIX hydrolase/histidine phosphatase family protein [Corynebacterium cystitidis]WJY82286.1 NUDIX domain protein [Corynebacterium cystitidis DSM 20524]SES19373.1 8-oxo-dGTP diphosphatase [Corynebacterium cystitidis DSM 20524]SNV76854.1 NTP pyrophosphohydrolase [Corynebacterium cystitidis]
MGKHTALHETDKDTRGEKWVTGRLQRIPNRPIKEFANTTLAAGAVLWRLDNTGAIEVACIHRPHYDDWSLAKGKVDPMESLPVTAVREIKEETGYDVRLGKLLGKTIYPVGGAMKVVYYWTGEVTGGEFVPNDEVDEIRWLPMGQAQELMTYELDTAVLMKAEKRLRTPPSARVLFVRHAKAHDREKWDGDDDLRPLEKKGRHQAELLVPMLTAFGPTRIYSALPDRCQQTAAPLADELGIDVVVDKRFGDDGWLESQVKAQRAFMDVVEDGGVSVIVGQGVIIPDMIAWLSARGRLPIDDEIKAKKASVWVLSFVDGELTGADYMPSPLPVR